MPFLTFPFFFHFLSFWHRNSYDMTIVTPLTLFDHAVTSPDNSKNLAEHEDYEFEIWDFSGDFWVSL